MERGTEPGTIRGIVEVRRHPTVVRLESLDEPDAGWITESYCVTEALRRHHHALGQVLARPAGTGVFLIGQYGSGKSHFLAWLIAQLRADALLPEGPEVAFASLLHFPAEQRLEDVVAETLGMEGSPGDGRLGDLRPGEQRGGDRLLGDRLLGDRRPRWSALSDRHPRGIVLVLDELSEFLRAKADRRALNEDVRFLQFLGEWAVAHRFWVVAAVQETIERTGDLEHDLYRKIKDRFPLRLLLTPTHVRDLIADAILQKSPAYSAAVTEVIARLREATPPEIPIDASLIQSIYPVHPVTLELLEEVRDRFSQARGIIDFTVTRLAGDPGGRVPPLLDRPVGEFLTADAIVDHYLELLQVQPEFLPLSERLLPYYERQLAALFPKPAQRALAERVLKLLTLVHLSRAREYISAPEVVYALGVTAARVAPERNVEIVERVLRRLVEHGRYVVGQSGRFRLELEDESADELAGLLARELADLEDQGDGLFPQVLPLLRGERFSLLREPEDRWQSRQVTWHHHRRSYQVWLGSGEPSSLPEGPLLCVRLPWGRAEPAECPTVIPARIAPGPEVREAVALARLIERALDDRVKDRARQRLGERLEAVESQILAAFGATRRFGPDRASALPGSAATPPRSLEEWLAGEARWLMQATYPAFERFAPTHGPLPVEAFRALLRHLESADIESPSENELVGLVRDAYLVPMELLRPSGLSYRLPATLERHELVRLVLPLLAHRPSPETLYNVLGSPIYGLVPDQVHALLLLLQSQGELELWKGRRTLRELHETLPLPRSYDRVERGATLDSPSTQALELLCHALSVQAPKTWTVVSQRRAVQRLAEAARARSEPLEALAIKLERRGDAEKLVGRIRRLLGWVGILDGAEEPLQAFRQLLYEVGSANRFEEELAGLTRLPQRLDRLLGDRARHVHLLEAIGRLEAVDTDVLLHLEALGPAPDLEDPSTLEGWLGRAAETYAAYERSYLGRHDAFWHRVDELPLWRWAPSGLASSRHVGLEEALARHRAVREQAEALRCRRMSDLEFQPICRCGFDGARAPIEDLLERLASLQGEIEATLERFFAQADVRRRVERWVAEGLETTPETLAYLDGKEALPGIRDLRMLDRHLAGLELVKRIPVQPVVDLLTRQPWERGELLEALGDLLAAHGDQRLRIEAASPFGPSDTSIHRWCLEQSLSSGVPLPAGLDPSALAEAAREVDGTWVGAEALRRLESLGLPRATLVRILGWIADRSLLASLPADPSAAVRCALEVREPSWPDRPEELARLLDLLYRHHELLRDAAGQPWLHRLDVLARGARIEALPELVALLQAHSSAQWLVIDGLGLPLAESVARELDAVLPSHRLAEVVYAATPAVTTTEAFLQALAEAGIEHPFEKVTVFDRLLHERPLPFSELAPLAIVELTIALRPLRERLDPARPLLVFADHGFRLAADGRSFTHSGGSGLERIVPLFRLLPRGRSAEPEPAHGVEG